MRRRGHIRYHEPKADDLKDIEGVQVLYALKVVFRRPINIDRGLLRTLKVMDGNWIDTLTDKEVANYDLESWAFKILHNLLSGGLDALKPKPFLEPTPPPLCEK